MFGNHRRWDGEVMKAGYVVKLKSGGHAMTINSVYTRPGSSEKKYRCVWFAEGDARIHSHSFSKESLLQILPNPAKVMDQRKEVKSVISPKD